MKLTVISLMLLALMTGCGQTLQNGASSSQDTKQNQIHVQQIAPNKQEIKDSKAVAERLEQLAVSIPGVQSAHCVVFGNTAVVGINVNPEMDRTKVGTVKYSVAEALRKDPHGANAVVTADMDLDHRLRVISDNIRSGRPVSGFAEQMSEIIGRMMPQLPQDTRNTESDPVPHDANQVGKPNL